MQYERGNLDKETYDELWKAVVQLWIEILFVESGYFGWQFTPGIRAQEQGVLYQYVIAWSQHRHI